MAVDYNQYVADLENMIAMDATDAVFQEIIPAIINYAEMRIYRELDLVQTTQRDTTVMLTIGNQNAALPQTFVVVQGINLLAAHIDPTIAVRTPLMPVSKEAIYNLWGDPTLTAAPEIYAMVDQWNILLGPSPDDDYGIEVYGTFRPEPLSPTNTTTFLTTWLYDLFLAASMIFVSGYMRNFGTMSNDPQMGMAWETQYQALKASANMEELRKKSWSDSWTTYPPSPVAAPPRGQ